MSLVVRDRALPSRVTGSPVRWARDFAIGGALVPLSYGLPQVVDFLPAWVGLSQLRGAGAPVDLALVAACAGVFGLLGAVTPLLLDPLRRGVPLTLLAVLAAVTGPAAMQLAWWLSGSGSWNLLAQLMLDAGVFGVFLWLPYTVCVVTGRSTWLLVLAPLWARIALQLIFLPWLLVQLV